MAKYFFFQKKWLSAVCRQVGAKTDAGRRIEYLASGYLAVDAANICAEILYYIEFIRSLNPHVYFKDMTVAQV